MNAQAIEALYQALSALALAMPRLLVCLMLVPAFFPAVIRGNLRNAIALALALPVAYRLHGQWPAGSLGYAVMAALVLKETALGLLVGFLMALPFWLFQALGTFLDNQRGANAMQINNPSVGSDASALGGLTVQAVTILAIQTGAMSAMLAFVYQSYLAWPPLDGLPPLTADGLQLWIDAFAAMIKAAILYCAPPMIVLLLVDFAFAMVGMVAPQLQVSSAAAPIKSLAGLFVLAIYAATLWEFAGREFAGLGDFAARLWGAR